MNSKVKIYNQKPICPRCGRTYTGYPAVSRADNNTDICSDCGRQEALVSFCMYQNGTSEAEIMDILSQDLKITTQQLKVVQSGS